MPGDAWSILDTCLTPVGGFLLVRSSVDGVLEVQPDPREGAGDDTGAGAKLGAGARGVANGR